MNVIPLMKTLTKGYPNKMDNDKFPAVKPLSADKIIAGSS
jgi:hypothetical protein